MTFRWELTQMGWTLRLEIMTKELQLSTCTSLLKSHALQQISTTILTLSNANYVPL